MLNRSLDPIICLWPALSMDMREREGHSRLNLLKKLDKKMQEEEVNSIAIKSSDNLP